MLGVHLTQTFVTLEVVTIGAVKRLDNLSAILLGVGVVDLTFVGDGVERGLGDIKMTGLNNLGHVAEEKGQQEGADVGPVHVGVGHDNDAVVTQVFQAEVIANAGPHGGDEGPDFVIAQHSIQMRPFRVQNLPPQGQNGLEAAIPAHLGAAAGAITLDNVKLGQAGIPFRTVGQLAGQGHRGEGVLANDQIPRFSGRFSGPGRGLAFVHDDLGFFRVGFQVDIGDIGHHRLDRIANVGIHQFDFGLTFKLRVGVLNRNDGRQPFPNIIPEKVVIALS